MKYYRKREGLEKREQINMLENVFVQAAQEEKGTTSVQRVMRENPNCLCDKTQREGGFKMMVMMVKNRIIKDRIYIIRGEE